ncbi:M56 family metallopeptidase [Chryseobacterium sp. Ch-15]|uniref:M56 family metallopeptidase n=1 Tax=Chryseobacterium muglaense TaxID=2893752 RepID=A0A9Q3UXZ4_9FLAO|nr:M56 family metallopeptidase [Chryseobacterium muglaense]MBD3904299.1 hypothetical protein [Chryseobacterium muglaense]MCC9035384.1 M56 family metallopeptidase [Chryseobacterium muglaense]MCM2553951.1 M56 family metallopeptidase [Chryseobacterium muglaense]
MVTIVLKIILCSGILLGLYHLFLAKEKTFTFNRYYLISALLFSLCIPFATIETKEAVEEIPSTVFVESIEKPVETQIVTPEENFDYTKALLIGYCIVSGILIFKIGYSIIKIKKLKGRKIKYQNRTVFLLKQDFAPFSFWNTIYLSETYFKDFKIEDSVFRHEEIHVKQKHSLDILFVEVLKAVFWINPLIWFYKKAMVNNHEFLADESVISQNKNIKKYQELILQEILKQQNLPLIHQFNFNNTKKRFIMMNNKNSKFANAKKYLAIPAFAALAVLFAERVYAKDDVEQKSNSKIAASSKNQSTTHSEAYRQFVKIIEKYNQIVKDQDYEKFSKEVPRDEQIQLADFYLKFNSKDIIETQVHVTYAEINREIPTSSQLNKFIDTKYNISLDGKVVENKVLKNYKNTDFYSVYILKVIPTNPDYGKYEYGVVLYTNSYAKKYNAAKNIRIGFKASDEELEFLQLRKDTITPKTTIDVKLVEIKDTYSDINSTSVRIVGGGTVEAGSTAVEGVAADLVPAEYPGGINELRKKVSKNFNSVIFGETNGLVRSTITFVVDKNGSIRDLKAEGENEKFNNEVLRVAKEANENVTWKPATKDGEPVAYRYNLPIAMQFTAYNKTQ